MIAGWDNAPLVELDRAQAPKQLTIVYPYYDNPFTLWKRIDQWHRLPSHIKKHLTAIIVDDGSPDFPASQIFYQHTSPFPIRLFRIEVDVRWNWLAARNIAMSHALEGWCVATDIDHIILESVLASLIWEHHLDGFIYRFGRREISGQTIHPHPNSWFMQRSTFWKFGGYDEALSGYYGTDGEARRRWVKTAPVRTLRYELIREENVKDSSTTRYGRKEPIDKKAQEIIKNRKSDWEPTVLSFPYHEVVI